MISERELRGSVSAEFSNAFEWRFRRNSAVARQQRARRLRLLKSNEIIEHRN